ncbi:hypothetical protein AMTR_s00015p00094260 [Amborella trichopoda]|uniref:Uncharacterized protein n=1 Tax=Amborella trichopoda TaxID=13333 RepID=W1PLD5_AMBTC|nr:hypothetical protein AMTR_s00015p00094260 [Amborella trichopoda]
MSSEEQPDLGNEHEALFHYHPTQEVLPIEALNELDSSAIAESSLSASMSTHNAEGMKILRIPSSLSPMPMHNTVGTKILLIPTSLPQAGTVSTDIKELNTDLKVLQILTSLRKQDDPLTLRVSSPPNHLKVPQIPKVLHIKRGKSDQYRPFMLHQ